MRKRLRNRFFRWLGVVPYDDFQAYIDDSFKVLESFEKFTRSTHGFCNVVAERLGIRFDGEKVVYDEKTEVARQIDEDRSRGII